MKSLDDYNPPPYPKSENYKMAVEKQMIEIHACDEAIPLNKCVWLHEAWMVEGFVKFDTRLTYQSLEPGFAPADGVAKKMHFDKDQIWEITDPWGGHHNVICDKATILSLLKFEEVDT